MNEGSSQAQVLKLADRISNLTALGFVIDAAFVRRYIDETRACILPFANAINPDMFRELSDLVDSRERFLRLIETDAAGPSGPGSGLTELQ